MTHSYMFKFLDISYNRKNIMISKIFWYKYISLYHNYCNIVP